MLDFRLAAHTNTLSSMQGSALFADRPYQYALSGRVNGTPFRDDTLSDLRLADEGGEMVIRGQFDNAGLILTRHLRNIGNGIEEILTLRNPGTFTVEIDRIEIGYVASLETRKDWRLIAIPFRVQLDGSVHDYSGQDLIDGAFHNAVYSDKTRPEPPLTEEGILRSEAWKWGIGNEGLVIIKYNNTDIELSVAAPIKHEGEWRLRFGGAGFALYGEPSAVRVLRPGAEYTFGVTAYIPYQGGISDAYEIYRNYIDRRGHGFSIDYDPPINWNELYDVGWYHSDPVKLRQFYTREALLKEAEKARAIGCDLLYLDPGWEVIEGITLWDQARLGPVDEFIRTLKEQYGLDLGYRTILRTYRDYWPRRYMVKHADRESGPIEFYPAGGPDGWEPCLANREFWEEKLRRILAISRHGVRFMMFDEMDWRGPCHDPSHGHSVPSTPIEHIRAVYALAREVRRQCPGLTAEVHDPVWPWAVSVYVPTYFGQGFGEQGSYEENWGFEYMWDCLNDLRSGRALALYYYALGCNVPLYLHITMAADNDACVFFWWTASTVRHIGIGGKTSNKTIEPAGGLPPYDPEVRFAAYQSAIRTYKRLKPFFARGRFHGIAEHIHLHTLPGVSGGVINVFNLTDAEQHMVFRVPLSRLSTTRLLPVKGAKAVWDDEAVTFSLSLPGMTPALIEVGEL
ncbi:MAG: hypothetical protein NZM42_05885 [Gemmatales bacterium]|nr:hypothetical protein [Gemmatales bacterium]